MARDLFVSGVKFSSCPMGNTVGEYESIHVVGLVLKTASEHPSTTYFNFIAILVLPMANRVIGAHCLRKGAW